MNNNALISVSSKQIGNEDELVEIVTQGKFYKENNCYFAEYEETELSGMEGTTTTLKIKEDQFSLIRMGTTNTKMKFKDKDYDISLYDTPYGTMELEIETNKLDIKVDDGGGEVFIDYNLSFQGQQPINTLLKIDIKPN